MRSVLVTALTCVPLLALSGIAVPSRPSDILERRGINEFLRKVAEDMAFGPHIHDAEPPKGKIGAEGHRFGDALFEGEAKGWRVSLAAGTSSSKGRGTSGAQEKEKGRK